VGNGNKSQAEPPYVKIDYIEGLVLNRCSSGYVLQPTNLRKTTSNSLDIKGCGEFLFDIEVTDVHEIPTSPAPHKRVKARVGAETVRAGSDRHGWLLQRTSLDVGGNPTRIYTPDVSVDDRYAIFNTSLILRVETAYQDLIFLRLFLEISGVCKGLHTWYKVGTKMMKARHMRQSYCCILPFKCQGLESALPLRSFTSLKAEMAQQL
jgi:hypothetical protein